MWKFTPYVLKTLWRHRARTILTVSGSAVAMFVFCFVGAMEEGMKDLQRRSEAKQLLVTFQANKFCPATSHLPQDYERTINGISGVRDVVPIQVFTNNCRASLDVVVFLGVPAAILPKVREFALIDGGWASFLQRQDGAMVGAAVAKRRGLGVGDGLSMGDITVTVAGVYRCPDQAEENYIYTHLDFLQRSKASHGAGSVTQFEIVLQSNVDPEAKCREIDDAFRAAAVQTYTRPKGVFQAKSLSDLVQFMAMARYLGYACVGLVLVLVATTTVMSVQDRVQEHAVLQTIGFSSLRVGSLIVTESIILSLAGGTMGVMVGVAMLKAQGLAVGAEGVMMTFRPTVDLALVALGVSFLVGVLSGIVPAAQAARMNIVSALRR